MVKLFDFGYILELHRFKFCPPVRLQNTRGHFHLNKMLNLFHFRYWKQYSHTSLTLYTLYCVKTLLWRYKILHQGKTWYTVKLQDAPTQILHNCIILVLTKTQWTRMWANAQRDGRPVEYRWRPLFNAAKFGWRPLPQCRAVPLPRRKTRWN